MWGEGLESQARDPRLARLGAWGRARHSGMAQASRAAFLPHSCLRPSPPGLTSKSKKGNSEGFLEPAPRGRLCWGGQREGGRGRRKAEKKAEARQRAQSTFEAVSNPSQGGWGGSESRAGGRQSRVLKNVSNSCGNQRDCKSSPSPTHLLLSPLPLPPKSRPPHLGAPTLCPQVIAGRCLCV